MWGQQDAPLPGQYRRFNGPILPLHEELNELNYFYHFKLAFNKNKCVKEERVTTIAVN
jgi:hypothetical protein